MGCFCFCIFFSKIITYLQKIFRLNPRVEEKVGDGVTAYAPGLDVQPGKAYGDGKQREDGEEVSYLYFEIFIQNDQMVLIG